MIGPRATFAAALLLLASAPVAGAASHSDEIQAYVVITAMAQTASDRCADLLVNNKMIETVPSAFHIAAEDEQAVHFAYDLEMWRLAAATEAAPSQRAWCDEAYRAYGPEGDAAKGLLGR